MKKSALLVIDVQKDFTQSSGRLPVDLNHAARMIANINAIVASTDTEILLPIYIANEFRKFDPLNIFRNFSAIRVRLAAPPAAPWISTRVPFCTLAIRCSIW